MALPVLPEGSGLPCASRRPSQAAHTPWRLLGRLVPAGCEEGEAACSTHRYEAKPELARYTIETELPRMAYHVRSRQVAPAHALAHAHAHAHARTRTHTRARARTRAHAHTHAHAHMHMFVHAYAHTHAHTHARTLAHLHK